jgi:hypothetical protein
MTELGEFSMYLAVGLMGVGFFFGPIGKAIGRWIESRSGGGHRLHEVESRLADLEQLTQRTPSQGVPADRLAELEERVDFAERLLARRSTPEALS